MNGKARSGSTAGAGQETPYVIGLLSTVVEGPPIPDRRVAELVGLINDGLSRDIMPLAFNSHLVVVARDVPFIFCGVSVCGSAAALTGLVLQTLNPFSYRW